jgi:hypothetical protein
LVVREPTVTSGVASFVIRAVPQYSDSGPELRTTPFSYVTFLQYLQSLRASQDVAAQVMRINAAAKKRFLFIIINWF